MSTPKGYSSQEKEDRLSAQFQTVEPVREMQFGSSVVAHQFVRDVGTDAAEAGSTASVIVATGHSALKGDVIRFTTGTLAGLEAKVWSVSANSITLAETLSGVPASGDAFQVLRHKYPLVNTDGTLSVAASFSEGATAADGAPLPAVVKVIGGYDGSAVQVIKTDSDGNLQADILSSALPTGAATEATLSTIAGAVSGTEMQADIKSIEGTISTANSTTAPLAPYAVFSGAWEEIKNYASIQVGIFALYDSLPNGVKIYFSSDGVSIHHTHTFSYLGASGGVGYVFQPEFRYFQIQFMNDATTQNYFRIITTFRPVAIPPSLYPANYTFSGQSQVSLTKGIIVGETTGGGGGYVPVKVNPSGALTVEASITSSTLPTGAATEATLSSLNGKVTACNTGAVTISAPLPSGTNTIGNVGFAALSVVDLLDAEILNTSSTNIAGSASSPTQVVSSLAAAVKKLQLLDTTGAFIGVYTGAAASEVLQLVMGPGSDQTIEHSITAGTRISLKRLDSTAAISSGIVAINFLG